ncbi:MAG: radical SAM protein [Myxococcota bacterium]
MSVRHRIRDGLPPTVRGWVVTARGRLRRLRTDRAVTRVLGTAHRRSRDRVELDVTWACNLRCFNCNRSCEQAPTGEGMTVDQVRRFVDESLGRGKAWERIRVLGGEPTLHPRFDELLAELGRYHAAFPGTVIELATHGHGERVRAVLARLPAWLRVEDSGKEGPEQPFHTFNVAPIDVPAYRRADFRNGCAITSTCGIGLTPYGWYPCAVAGSIDRIVGLGLGRKELPDDDDDLHAELAAFCRLCGHFKREADPPVTGPVQSPTWVRAYARWRLRPPRHGRY